MHRSRRMSERRTQLRINRINFQADNVKEMTSVNSPSSATGIARGGKTPSRTLPQRAVRSGPWVPTPVVRVRVEQAGRQMEAHLVAEGKTGKAATRVGACVQSWPCSHMCKWDILPTTRRRLPHGTSYIMTANWLWAWSAVDHNHCWKQHWYFCLSLPPFFCVSVFCFYGSGVWFRRMNEWIWPDMAVGTKQVNLGLIF